MKEVWPDKRAIDEGLGVFLMLMPRTVDSGVTFVPDYLLKLIKRGCSSHTLWK